MELPYIWHETMVQHIGRHFCLEFTFRDEKDNRPKDVVAELQELRQTSSVPVILSYWILKLLLPTENVLGPFVAFGRAEYPPFEILRLDHEYSKDGQDDVVDLGCAVLGWDDCVVNSIVNPLIQEGPHANRGHFLAKPAFEDIDHIN